MQGLERTLDLTSTKAETALWMLTGDGGSNARDSTSSIELPSFTFNILILRARSLRLRRIISGSGCSDIYPQGQSEDVAEQS